MDREESVQHFLDLIKKSRRGKFKVYIGMIAGVGKSYRMLQEAHDLLDNGVDVQIGYIETHFSYLGESIGFIPAVASHVLPICDHVLAQGQFVVP